MTENLKHLDQHILMQYTVSVKLNKGIQSQSD
jgi:hypothetical protein